jgi:hypothetical protein
MKRALAILVTLILVASGMHISIDRHYCGGTLADVKISVTGKLASCGMEPNDSDCGNHPLFDQKCCEDQFSYITISSNYSPEYFRITHQISEKEIILKREVSFISCNLYNPETYNLVLPPGDHPGRRLTQSDICIFRI